MIPINFKTLKPVIILAGLVLSTLAIGYGVVRYYQNKAIQSEAQANEAKGAADAAKQQAKTKDAAIEAQANQLAEARADVARKLSQLAAYRAALPASPAVDPVSDEPIFPGVVDLAPLVRKQDEVIQAQSHYIQGLETKITDLTMSRDLWKSSEEARSREAAGLRIALEAQKSLTKGALWKGRIQGLAIGIAGGYLYGSIR